MIQRRGRALPQSRRRPPPPRRRQPRPPPPPAAAGMSRCPLASRRQGPQPPRPPRPSTATPARPRHCSPRSRLSGGREPLQPGSPRPCPPTLAQTGCGARVRLLGTDSRRPCAQDSRPRSKPTLGLAAWGTQVFVTPPESPVGEASGSLVALDGYGALAAKTPVAAAAPSAPAALAMPSTLIHQLVQPGVQLTWNNQLAAAHAALAPLSSVSPRHALHLAEVRAASLSGKAKGDGWEHDGATPTHGGMSHGSGSALSPPPRRVPALAVFRLTWCGKPSRAGSASVTSCWRRSIAWTSCYRSSLITQPSWYVCLLCAPLRGSPVSAQPVCAVPTKALAGRRYLGAPSLPGA